MLLFLALSGLAVGILLGLIGEKREEASPAGHDTIRTETLVDRDSTDVLRIEVDHRDQPGWAAEQKEEGMLTEDGGFPLDASMAARYLLAAADIQAENVLARDLKEVTEDLSEFGLDKPEVTVTVRYRDGRTARFFIGSHAPEADQGWYYMRFEGRDELFALDAGTAEEWMMSRSTLHSVEQPRMQASRMDHILLQWKDREAEWKLDGSITDEDASDHWLMIRPDVYPADGTEMSRYLSIMESVRMGIYIGEASGEKLKEYGLDQPRLIMRIHMAEGMTGYTDGEGAVRTEVLPEEEVEIRVGNMREGSDFLVYVQYHRQIALCSTLTLGPLIQMEPDATLSRYVVSIPSESVRKLTWTGRGETRVYEILEEVSTDGEGNMVTEKKCLFNGTSVPFESFQALYAPLEKATVSGRIPESLRWTAQWHTEIVLESDTGRKQRIRLFDCDGLHDAVQIDDYGVLFYMVRGGLGFQ